MASTLLLIFLLHLLPAIFAPFAFRPLLWRLYLLLPTQTSHLRTTQQILKRDFNLNQTSLSQTSAQAAFSTWAKLNRRREALLAQVKTNTEQLERHEAAFGQALQVLAWLTLTLPLWWVQWSWAKEPVFWLRKGWAPAWVEWIAAWPRAQSGAIGVVVWGAACRAVVKLGGEGVGAVKGLMGEKKVSAGPEKVGRDSGEKSL
ncbi:MAG: GET complex subunit get1 [Vezdaea aestivalis]|nr:MAG: GET complex subunit get1 [Vezdaea aestivalis]